MSPVLFFSASDWSGASFANESFSWNPYPPHPVPKIIISIMATFSLLMLLLFACLCCQQQWWIKKKKLNVGETWLFLSFVYVLQLSICLWYCLHQSLPNKILAEFLFEILNDLLKLVFFFGDREGISPENKH